jgi:phosphoglycolate phosphatase-like HAD superfamily hydrolase
MAKHEFPPALVLFDIDGTLLRRSGPDHRRVLEEAVWHVAGLRTTTDGVPVQGMLDREILRQMMRNAGAAEALVKRALPAIVAKAQSLYARRCPDLRDKVCPGAKETLAALARSGAVIGLVTGNLSRIGWRKMERAGLKRHIRFGAFAEQAPTRTALARLALRHARRERWIVAGSAASLVGDHPNDIAAARGNGLRSVAVATGVVPYDELASHGPDILVPDLTALDWKCLLQP